MKKKQLFTIYVSKFNAKKYLLEIKLKPRNYKSLQN